MGLLLDSVSRRLASAAAWLRGSRPERRLRVPATEGAAAQERLALAGRLAGLLTHELNNPLAVVLLNLEGMLLRRPDDELIADTIDGARRIAELVESLSQLAGDTAPGWPETFELDQLLDVILSAAKVDVSLRELDLVRVGGKKAIRTTAVLRDLCGVIMHLLAAVARERAASGVRGGRIEVGVTLEAGRPVVWLHDPHVTLGESERTRLFDPRIAARDGRARLDLEPTLAFQWVTRAGAALAVDGTHAGGTRLRLTLTPAAP